MHPLLHFIKTLLESVSTLEDILWRIIYFHISRLRLIIRAPLTYINCDRSRCRLLAVFLSQVDLTLQRAGIILNTNLIPLKPRRLFSNASSFMYSNIETWRLVYTNFNKVALTWLNYILVSPFCVNQAGYESVVFVRNNITH